MELWYVRMSISCEWCIWQWCTSAVSASALQPNIVQLYKHDIIRIIQPRFSFYFTLFTVKISVFARAWYGKPYQNSVSCSVVQWYTTIVMGARRNFSRVGQNQRHFKKLTRFRRAVKKSTIFRRAEDATSSQHFRLKYRVSIASAEGGSEILGYFVGEQHMTSSFLNSSPANIRTCELWVWTVVPCFIPHYGGISLYRRAWYGVLIRLSVSRSSEYGNF